MQIHVHFPHFDRVPAFAHMIPDLFTVRLLLVSCAEHHCRRETSIHAMGCLREDRRQTEEEELPNSMPVHVMSLTSDHPCCRDYEIQE